MGRKSQFFDWYKTGIIVSLKVPCLVPGIGEKVLTEIQSLATGCCGLHDQAQTMSSFFRQLVGPFRFKLSTMILRIGCVCPDNIHPTARCDGRSIMGIVAVLFLVLKILIKAVGDELRHPPFIRSSNRVLIMG